MRCSSPSPDTYHGKRPPHFPSPIKNLRVEQNEERGRDSLVSKVPRHTCVHIISTFCVNGVAMNIGYSQPQLGRAEAMLGYGYTHDCD